MTVYELIEELKKYPPETRTVIPYCEGGYVDIIGVKKEPIVLNCLNMFHYGNHEIKRNYEADLKEEVHFVLPPEKTGGVTDAVILTDDLWDFEKGK